MFYEWDDSKAALNRQKHDVSFGAVEQFEWDTALIKDDTRQDYGEDRYNAMGLAQGRLHQLTFVLRGDAIRVISFRKANQREIKHYGNQTKTSK